MTIFRSLILCLLAASLLLTGAARAQGSTPAAGDPPPLTAQELDSLLAPIALYPDALLSQILMASTYPLEVVSAARWVKANPDIKGDAALKKVENETWDVSVKSLAAFPSILDMMNEKLDWTQKLGDAFLAQQKDVLASVQRLRQLAKNNGNLESNQQQVVRSEAQSIIIEPAQPQTIYVPSYNPTVVYGTWPYPAYPPYYYPPSPYYYPGGALATGLAWGRRHSGRCRANRRRQLGWRRCHHQRESRCEYRPQLQPQQQQLVAAQFAAPRQCRLSRLRLATEIRQQAGAGPAVTR